MHGGSSCILLTSHEWILEDLRQHLTTDEIDEVILFAREAGYLDADAQLTEAGERYFRLMTDSFPLRLVTGLHTK